MKTLQITVNGRPVIETIDDRTHLADFLRDKLNLTATHLRCEQGVCGACTLLIDGEPARSCITYAGLCEGAEVTTLEGLEHDPVIAALRDAFSAEHGLQCGFCTPGMLVTARDIIVRLPDADDARVRLELSGNLCRCTGYVGIVRAIRRVLDARRAGMLTVQARPRQDLGPVGARTPGAPAAIGRSAPSPAAEPPTEGEAGSPGVTGLGSATPNLTLHQSFAVPQSPDEVWRVLSDIERVAPCMPGASLAGPIQGNRVPGRMTVNLGPISATFSGEARVTRDDVARRGKIAGGGRDRFTRSRVAADLAYSVRPQAGGAGTIVDIDVRALLTGPLAQFSRGGLVEEVAARLTQMFAANLERQMAGGDAPRAGSQTSLGAGSLIGGALLARLRAWLKRIYRIGKPGP